MAGGRRFRLGGADPLVRAGRPRPASGTRYGSCFSRSCAPQPTRRLIPCGFAMLELSPNDPLIKTYLKDLQHLKSPSVTHELGLKGPFQTLLDKAAKRRGWTLVPELSTYSGGKRVVPDGTVRDEFR